MKNRDTIQTDLESHLQKLTETALPSLDFDALVATLADVRALLQAPSTDTEALMTLRRDYEARIAGMRKAIAAVRGSSEALHAATVEIEQLARLSVAELIDRYRKTSAQFRDAFPASFGLIDRRGGTPVGRNLSDFK